MSDPVIAIKNVSYSYNGVNAVDSVTFDVFDHDFMGIVGPNGGGKTTLLRLILGFLPPQSGSITVLGRAPKLARKHIGYVPQHGNMDSTVPVSVEEVVVMGAAGPGYLFPATKPAHKAIAEEMMHKTGILELATRPFSSLSGGQRQRCLIARALASRPDILLLDEPTANVDSRKERDIYELFKELNESITILLVSHDIGFISSYINRVACINHQASVHTTSEITTEALLHETYNENTVMIKHQCEL